ncbi:hypothetical protein H4582DRAFT_2026111, partial [Lactarius indigo]
MSTFRSSGHDLFQSGFVDSQHTCDYTSPSSNIDSSNFRLRPVLLSFAHISTLLVSRFFFVGIATLFSGGSLLSNPSKHGLFRFILIALMGVVIRSSVNLHGLRLGLFFTYLSCKHV